jgi:prephenate dehydrogenase
MGLALKGRGVESRIVGYDPEPATLKAAKQREAIDMAESRLPSAVEGAGVVIMDLPLSAMEEAFEIMAEHLWEGAVVTDTATAKERVLEWAEALLPSGVHFVGGDPIIGEEERGLEAAREDLFQGVTYCLIPSPRAHPKAVELMVRLVRTLGAEPFFLGATEHDGEMALMGHLPHLMGAALFRAACRGPAWRDLSKLISPHFERVTRFPSSEPGLYRDICLSNREHLSRSIDLLMERLEEAKEMLARGDEEGLVELFSDPISDRQGWLKVKQADFSHTAENMEEIRQMRRLGGLGQYLGLTPRRPIRKP